MQLNLPAESSQSNHVNCVAFAVCNGLKLQLRSPPIKAGNLIEGVSPCKLPHVCCVRNKLASQRVLQEIDELFKIFHVLGTPHEGIWPGVTQFADFKDTFPKWDRISWRVRRLLLYVRSHNTLPDSFRNYIGACAGNGSKPRTPGAGSVVSDVKV